MIPFRSAFLASLAGALTLGLLGPVPRALGATINPTVFTDDITNNGNCTLREAIVAANDDMAVDQCPAGSGPDIINLQAGTYSLTDQVEGSLEVFQDLTLIGAGPGTTIIDGAWTANPDRIFDVIDKADIVVTFSGLTIQDGNPALSGGGGIRADSNTIVTLDDVAVSGNRGPNGGGIRNSGTMTITNSSVTGNTATGCCAGIFNDGVGTLTMTDSIIAGNAATSSDGGLLNNGTAATLTGVTISGNTSGAQGSGGMSADATMTTLTNVTITGNSTTGEGGGLVAYQSAVLNNVTITGNTANSDGDADGDGGGLYLEGIPALTIRNSIVAGNQDGGGEGPDCFGTAISGGHNLIQNTTGCTGFTGPGDLTGLNPLLGPLADNGGPTMTHALLKGSPAIDAGGTDCAATDQRGLPRNCDIGAYELVLCGKVPVNRIGTSGKDSLTGTAGSDGLLGLSGNDKLRGKGGKDGLCAGPGKDLLKGGGARDRLDGGPGKDLCAGQAGKDKAKACEREKSIP